MTITVNVGRPRLRAQAFLLLTTVLCSGLAAPAYAQSAGSVAPPPVRNAIDDNGVDVLLGTYNISQTDLSIGADARQGLVYSRAAINGNWNPSAIAAISIGGSTANVMINNASDSFTVSGTTFTPTQGNGATLTLVSGDYIYTARDGTIAHFESDANYYFGVYQSNGAHVSSITYPDGTKVTFTYKIGQYCASGWEDGSCPGTTRYAIRLQSVNNSNGYHLKMTYAENDMADINTNNYSDWAVPTSVKAINNGAEYCDPAADSCSLTGSWPSASYTRSVDGSGNVTTTVTDPASRTTRYIKNFGAGQFKVKRAGASSDNIVVTYNSSTYVTTSVVREGVTYSYAYSDSGTTRTTTVTDPNGGQRVYVGDNSTFLLSSFRDELLRTTSYAYDSSGRLTQITYPEGNKLQYTYDTRGNVTATRAIAKTAGTPADIVTSATYPSSCTVAVTCNKPSASFDALGNETDYTYDSTHGGLLTATAPAPTTGGTHPQVRYGYTSMQGYYKNSSGSIVASGVATYRLTSVSSCQTTSSCTGAADEVKSTIGYGPQTSGTANNLLPVTSSSGSGNGTLTATTAVTYDSIGNKTYVDGPLSGTTDTTRILYDAARQKLGAIGPDPDGSGALTNRAVRLTYNLDGQVTKAELGTTNGQSDANWAALTPLQAVTTAYDTNARKITDTTSASGTNYGLVQYGYDALGRSDCVALRMNSAIWASLPTSACTLGTAGSFGPDRISKTFYDAASEVTKVQSALGTPDQSDDTIITYSNNGQQVTAADANGNLTTTEYDGFDRLLKTRLPSPTTVGTSSTTDYEQLVYDANSNVTSRRLRGYASDSTRHIDFAYDALNRVTLKTLPDTEPAVAYSYDNLNRLTAAYTSWNSVAIGYDALSRPISQTTPLGTTAMVYNLAGNRVTTVWPDSFYVNYDHLVTGEVSAVRENGATSGVGVLATYSYDNLGRRTGITRGNGTTTSYGFDNVSRLTSLAHDLYGTGNDLTLGFSYNPANQIAGTTRSNDSYAYGGSANSNLAYTVNGLNQDTAVGAGSLSYDARGNLTSTGSNSYTYSAENLLLTGPSSATLTYDPLMRLYEATGSATEFYGYDGPQRIAEYSGSGTMLRRYVYGPGDDEPLVWYEGSGTSDRRWLHADERGSVIALTNSSGASIGNNSYDEYGVPGSTNIGKFQYTGQAYLPDFGLYYYKARVYASRLGRFMQTDPIGYGSGMNWYNYVGGDPVNGTDPFGLSRQEDIKPVEPISPEVVVTATRDSPNTPNTPGMLGNVGVVGPDQFQERAEGDIGPDVVVTGTKIAAGDGSTINWILWYLFNRPLAPPPPPPANDNTLACTTAESMCRAHARMNSPGGSMLPTMQLCRAAAEDCTASAMSPPYSPYRPGFFDFPDRSVVTVPKNGPARYYAPGTYPGF